LKSISASFEFPFTLTDFLFPGRQRLAVIDEVCRSGIAVDFLRTVFRFLCTMLFIGKHLRCRITFSRSPMNKHKIFIAITLLEIGLGAMLFISGQSAVRAALSQQIGPKQQLVKFFDLTDLSIWTEARYTRHPSQTDFFTPFQDSPSSLEHFPAGSIISPLQGTPETRP